MKKKMLLENVKEEISECLLNGWKNCKAPLYMWLEIEAILKVNKIKQEFPYKEFKPLYTVFENTCKRKPDQAVNTFLSSLDSKPKIVDIAEVIEAPPRRKRKRERGVGKANKILLDALQILHETDEVIKKSKAKILKKELFRLIKISNYLLQKHKSIDSYLDFKNYPDPVKKLVADSLGTLLNVEMLFRGKWYSD